MQQTLPSTEWRDLRNYFERLRRISPGSYDRIEDLIDEQIRLRFGQAIYDAIKLQDRDGRSHRQRH
jgi:hypothetical protein